MENSTWSGSCPHCGCPIEGVHYEVCNRNKGKINYSVNEPKTMLNEFKERKMAEFEKQFGIPDYMNDLLKEPLKVVIEEQKQFISNLIDEMVGAIPEKKELPKNIRIDEGFPIDLIKAFCVEDQGFNKCRETLINKLK